MYGIQGLTASNVSELIENDSTSPVSKSLTASNISNGCIFQKDDKGIFYDTTDQTSLANCYYTLKRMENAKEDNDFRISLEALGLTCGNGKCNCKEGLEVLYLRTSLLETFKVAGILSEKWCHLQTGPVFTPCHIQTTGSHLPVQYQMLIMWHDANADNLPNLTDSQTSGNEFVDEIGEEEMSEIAYINSKIEYVDIGTDTETEMQIDHLHNVSEVYILKKMMKVLKRFIGEDCNIEFHRQCVQENLSRVLHVEKKVHRLGDFRINIGAANKISLGELVEIIDEHREENPKYLGLLLFIDELASLKFNFKDKRLLYSLDERVKKQYVQLGIVSAHEQKNYIRIPSLYPKIFIHDMSFWENDKLEFDETEFSNVIRTIADDVVFNIELIDRYKDPATGRHSRCYRMMFQSPDKALCYDISWKLQSLIRLEVEKHLQITLR